MEKAITISVGVCKRLHKEVGAYEREAAKEEARVVAMREAGADEHETRKAAEVAAETRRMVPDTQQRLAAAADKLRAQLAAAEASEEADDLRLTVAWTSAHELLATL